MLRVRAYHTSAWPAILAPVENKEKSVKYPQEPFCIQFLPAYYRLQTFLLEQLFPKPMLYLSCFLYFCPPNMDIKLIRMQRYTFSKITGSLILFSIFISSPESKAQITSKSDFTTVTSANVKVGAQHTEQYISLLKNKKVAVVANQTSLVHNTPLVDTLLGLGIKVVKILAPEHGYYGAGDAGANVGNDKTPQGIQIISLYGDHNKPTAEDFDGVDIVVYDIQDVGVRFFTYVSTLHLVMEACAETHKPLIVLDRPDPNGYYVDGPVLEPAFK